MWHLKLKRLLLKKRKRFKDHLIFPIIGYNDNDNIMLGLKFQIRDTSKNFNFYSYNLYSFHGHITGLGEFKYRIKLNSKSIKSIVPFLEYQRFSLFENNNLDYNLLYNRISPGVRIHLKCNDENSCRSILLKSSFINEGYARFTSASDFKITSLNSNMNRLAYYSTKRKEGYNSQFWTELDYFNYETPLNEKSNFLKLTASYKYEWAVSEKSNVSVRLWGSYFIMNDERESTNYSDDLTQGSAALIYQGHNDYAYDEIFLGRNNIDGIFKNQISYRGGGFKTPHTLSSNIGQSNNYALAINTFVEAPFSIIKLKPIIFADFGSYSQYQNEEFKNKYLYSIGVGIKARKGNMGIFLPLINSSDISDNYSSNKYNLLDRVSINFSLNLSY